MEEGAPQILTDDEISHRMRRIEAMNLALYSALFCAMGIIPGWLQTYIIFDRGDLYISLVFDLILLICVFSVFAERTVGRAVVVGFYFPCAILLGVGAACLSISTKFMLSPYDIERTIGACALLLGLRAILFAVDDGPSYGWDYPDEYSRLWQMQNRKTNSD